MRIAKQLGPVVCMGILNLTLLGQPLRNLQSAAYEKAPTESDVAAQSGSSIPANKLVATDGASEIAKETLPAGSRIYVSPMASGFDTYLIAGLQKKEVPLVVTTDKSKADFEVSGISESEKASWAKMLFMGSAQSAEQASIKIVNLKTGAVVFAYSVNKGNSVRGKQSAGEACAKHIKAKVQGKDDN